MMVMKRKIRIKRFFPYQPEYIWLALTQAKLLGGWFMENDIVPAADHEFTFRMAPQKGWNGITYCRITEVEPLHKISYTYRGSASGEKTLACAGIHSEAADKMTKGIFTELDTVLSFSLTPVCGGTVLTLEHFGFKGLKLVIVSFVMGMGWKKQFVEKLPLIMEEIVKKSL